MRTSLFCLCVILIASTDGASLPSTLTARLEGIVRNLRDESTVPAYVVLPPSTSPSNKDGLLSVVNTAAAAAHYCRLRKSGGGLTSATTKKFTSKKCQVINLVADDEFSVVAAKTVLYSFGAQCGQLRVLSPSSSEFRKVESKKHSKNKIIRYDSLPKAVAAKKAESLASSTQLPSNSTQPAKTVVVVLGNEALDDGIPTDDHIDRTLKAVAYAEGRSDVYIVATGGRTDNGLMSEAEMTQVIALSRGFPFEKLILENHATNTVENAEFSCQYIRALKPNEIYLVSKPSHLKWAMGVFKKHPEFLHAMPMPSAYTRAEELHQMEQCVSVCSVKRQKRIQDRISWLKSNTIGPDM